MKLSTILYIITLIFLIVTMIVMYYEKSQKVIGAYEEGFNGIQETLQTFSETPGTQASKECEECDPE